MTEQSIQSSLYTFTLLCTSAGEELLNSVMQDGEILNIDMVLEVVDWLRRAAELTRGRDLEMEAMALSSLGKVYDKVSGDYDER